MCPEAGDSLAIACLDGVCVSPECTPENPTACPDPSCQNDDDCEGGTASCSVGVCTAGTCFADADDALCSSVEYCDPGRGCLSGGTGSDAGEPDASADAAPVDSGVDAGICVPRGPDEGAPCDDADNDCDGSVDESCDPVVARDAQTAWIAGEPIVVEYAAPGSTNLTVTVACDGATRSFPVEGDGGTTTIRVNPTTDPYGRDCELQLFADGVFVETLRTLSIGRLIALRSDAISSQVIALDLGTRESHVRATIAGVEPLSSSAHARTITYATRGSAGASWTDYRVDHDEFESLGVMSFGEDVAPPVVASDVDRVFGFRNYGDGSLLFRRPRAASTITDGTSLLLRVPAAPGFARRDDSLWVAATRGSHALLELELSTMRLVRVKELPEEPSSLSVSSDHAYYVSRLSDDLMRIALDAPDDASSVAPFDGAPFNYEILYDNDNQRLIAFGTDASGYYVTVHWLSDGATERFPMGDPPAGLTAEWAVPQLIY